MRPKSPTGDGGEVIGSILEELRLDPASWNLLAAAATRAGVPADQLLVALLAVGLPDRAVSQALALGEAVAGDTALLAPLRLLEAQR